MPVLTDLIDALRSGRVAGRRPHRAAAQRHPDPAAAAAVRQRLAVRADRDQPLRRARARPGTGTTSTPPSTPAPTSTPRSTGSPARTATTWPRCRRPGWSRRPRCSTSPPRATRTSCSRSSTSPGLGGRARPAARRRLAALPHRLGRPQRGRGRVPERQRDRPAHAGDLRASAPAGWPRSPPVIGVGVETVGTDAGAAHSFDPPFPCHSFLLGAGKYGLTQLQNLARLPTTGAVVVAGPLPIVNGSGQPGPGAGPGRVVVIARRARSGAHAGRAGRRARLRGGRQRQLPRHQRAARGRGALPGHPARGRRGDHGRRLRPDQRPGRRAVGAPGLRADQRDDRHHRGGQEPHADDRAGRRHRGGRGPLQLPDRPVRAGRARSGAVAERVHTPASALADTVRAYRTAVEQRRTVVLNLPLDVQAQPAPEPAPLPDPPAPLGRRPARRRTRCARSPR